MLSKIKKTKPEKDKIACDKKDVQGASQGRGGGWQKKKKIEDVTSISKSEFLIDI